MEKKQDPFAIDMVDVRLLYSAALFEPQRGPKGEGQPKFSATLAFPPTHPVVALIKAAFQRVATEKWKDRAGAIFAEIKAGDKLCLHDGAAKASKPGYAGMLYVSASNKLRPLILDSNMAALTAVSGRPYSGCYVNARISLWPQDNEFGKRINASLGGVQFLRDGERLSGGGVASADDFQAIPEAGGATTAAVAAPAGGNPDPFA
jgi:hypothetical protein